MIFMAPAQTLTARPYPHLAAASGYPLME